MLMGEYEFNSNFLIADCSEHTSYKERGGHGPGNEKIQSQHTHMHAHTCTHTHTHRPYYNYLCSTLRRRIKGAASTINAIIRQPCYIFPVVGSYSTVASTVFAYQVS